jgi:hypothetical protein
MDRMTELEIITGLIFIGIGLAVIYLVGQFSIDLILTYIAFGFLVAGILELARLLVRNGHNRHR